MVLFWTKDMALLFMDTHWEALIFKAPQLLLRYAYDAECPYPAHLDVS
jgi:hypothetical protein